MEVEPETHLLPPFTLYPISSADLKTCYESASYKVILSLNGPYYSRWNTQLPPIINCSILNHSPKLHLSQEQGNKL